MIGRVNNKRFIQKGRAPEVKFEYLQRVEGQRWPLSSLLGRYISVRWLRAAGTGEADRIDMSIAGTPGMLCCNSGLDGDIGGAYGCACE
jgi:hypothetical protein